MDHKKVLHAATSLAVKSRGWIGKLSVKQTKEMELLKNAYNRLEPGKRPAVDTLRKMVSEELQIAIGKDTFREWLKPQSSCSVQSTRTVKTSKKTQTCVKRGVKE